jgi:pyrroline-5-carboxylate reductase
MATEKLTVAVLGAGNVGGTLGRKWIAARHQVVFAVSDPNGKHAQNVRGDLGNSVVIGSVADALNSNPEVVVLAVLSFILKNWLFLRKRATLPSAFSGSGFSHKMDLTQVC